MSDDVARALGAGGGNPFQINGKDLTPKPLTIKQITELQRDCVSVYRMEYLGRVKESLHLMDLDDRRAYYNNLVLETAKWDVDDLPKQEVYDTSDTKMTQELESWARNNLTGYTSDKPLVTKQRYIAFALDSEQLTEAEYEKRTGEPIKKQNGSYISWWVTGTPEGMLSMVWHSIKEDGVCTRAELEDHITKNQGTFTEMTREIESLSAPAVQGNGEDQTHSAA